MAAVTDYATLNAYVNAVFDRAGDADFTSQNDTFIGLAEAAFSPKLLSRRMETTTTLTTDSTGLVALPSDFFRARALYGTVNGLSINLPFLTPAQQQELYPVGTGQSPAYAKIIGTSLYIFPAAAQDVTLDYWQRFTGLSSGNTTNWIITYHPNLYVDAVCAQACRWLHEMDEAVRYEQSWRDIQDTITSNMAMEYFNNAELVLDTPTP